MITKSLKELIPFPCGILKIPASSELTHLNKTVYFSLIIPTYNESKNILAVVHLLSYLLDEALLNNYELIVIDDDLQHPPEVLLKLLEAIAQGAALAVASRNVPGGGISDWQWHRRFLSRGAQFLGLLILPSVVK